MDRRITNSQLNTDATCSRLHWFKYLAGGHGLKREYSSPALTIGSAVHAGIDAFVKAKQLGVRDEEELMREAIDAAQKDYNTVRPDDSDPDRLVRWTANEQMVLAMTGAYAWRYSRADEDIEWIGSEQEFEAPILNPATGHPVRGYVYGGKYDKLFRRNGKIVLRDHKTTGEQVHPGSAYMLRLQIDSQVSRYVLGLRRIGIEVEEVEWDVIRKPNISKQPKKLSAKEFSEMAETQSYCGFPVSVREHIEGDMHRVWVNDVEVTVEKLKTNGKPTIIESWEMYRLRAFAKMVGGDGVDYYFQREIVPVTAARLHDAAHDLYDGFKMLRERERLKRWPRNTTQCRAYNRLCPFFELCVRGFGVDSDYSPASLPSYFTAKDASHEELSEPQPEEEDAL